MVLIFRTELLDIPVKFEGETVSCRSVRPFFQYLHGQALMMGVRLLADHG
jgi:hypothetical protein